jgi:hypothetical protein
MTDRTASVIVCDEALFSVTGKAYLNGVYPSDITISGDALQIHQLVFYFAAETPKDKPFKKLTLKATFPGSGSTQFEINVDAVQQVHNPARPKMVVRAPLLVQQILLKPGKIETKVIDETGAELDAGGIWVTTTVPPTPT